MSTFTHSGLKLTYEDYVLFPDNGMIHELIDGEHYMTPAPATYHQTLSRRIQFQLYEQIEEKGLGQVFNAPTDVQFSEYDVVQPDIFVVLKEHALLITPSRVIGHPDLIIEIISESTQERDRKLKLDLYERGGVPEYWLVDPAEHSVRKFLLTSDRYRLAGTFREEIQYSGIAEIKVNLTSVW
jgi:Uma2 family endonuclease